MFGVTPCISLLLFLLFPQSDLCFANEKKIYYMIVSDVRLQISSNLTSTFCLALATRSVYICTKDNVNSTFRSRHHSSDSNQHFFLLCLFSLFSRLPPTVSHFLHLNAAPSQL